MAGGLLDLKHSSKHSNRTECSTYLNNMVVSMETMPSWHWNKWHVISLDDGIGAKPSGPPFVDGRKNTE